jgi:hypothetical protein
VGHEAYAQVYGPTTPGLNLASELTPVGQQALPTFENLCIPNDDAKLDAIATPLVGKFWATANPGATPPWNQLLQQNTPGSVKTPAPIFIAQDTADAVVPAASLRPSPSSCTPRATRWTRNPAGLNHEVIGSSRLARWRGEASRRPARPSTC